MDATTTTELATSLTDVGAKHWQPFAATTPGGIPFAGLICLAENAWMGALACDQVAGEPTFQLERCMPHLHYPYVAAQRGAAMRGDGEPDRTVVLPPGFAEARFYEKLDGTNLCWYPLRSPEGVVLEVVPKTRLRPVAAGSVWGDWPTLLAHAAPQDAIRRAMLETGLNLCFELWGRGNPHLVEYDRDLGLALHTGVTHDRLATPAALDAIAQRYGFERPACLATLSGDVAAITAAYRKFQQEFEDRNRAGGEGRYVTEGAILVLADAHSASYYKCKPPSIEEIHWAPSALSGPIVLQALAKLAEAGVELLPDDPEPLWAALREEWDTRILAAATELVERVYGEYLDEIERKHAVWARLEGASLPLADTLTVMRYLSGFYPRAQMGWVYAAYREYLARAGS